MDADHAQLDVGNVAILNDLDVIDCGLEVTDDFF